MTEPFENVVAQHGRTVLRVCRAVLGPDHADDAWSETFLAALRAYPDLPAGSNVEAWLVTIAHRKALDQIRSTGRAAQPTAQVPERPQHKNQPGGWESDLWEALAELPSKQRHAVIYHHIGGLPHADVALIVGVSAAAARRACADGIATLRSTYLRQEP